MTRRQSPGHAAGPVSNGFEQPAAMAQSAHRGAIDDRRAETMTVEERAAVQRGLEDMRACRLATDEEIQAAFRRFRP